MSSALVGVQDPPTRFVMFIHINGWGRDPTFPLDPFPVQRHILNFNLKGSVLFRPIQDAAGIKVGVAGRINDWLTKTPETGKTSGGRPAVSL